MEPAVHRLIAQDSPWPHRLALATAIATFPLLFVGGLVTSLGAGLAVPDWPTTFGYNMFLYPWSKMVGGIFYEHSHRLIGSLVGLLTMLLTLALWRYESRRWVRRLGVVALLAVIAQGVLGGLRVVLLQQTLAIVHACFAQAFFVLVASLTLFTSASWQAPVAPLTTRDANRVRLAACCTSALLYYQLVSGAVLRHTGTWLTLHLVGAVAVSLAVLSLAVFVRRRYLHVPALARPATILGNLLTVQLLLGFGSYLGKFTGAESLSEGAVVALTSSHVVGGALLLVTCVVLTLQTYRMLEPGATTLQSRFVSEQGTA